MVSFVDRLKTIARDNVFGKLARRHTRLSAAVSEYIFACLKLL